MSQIIEQTDINSSQLLMPWSFLREWKARIDLTLTSRGQTHFKSSLALLLRCYFTYLQSRPLLLGKRPYNSTLTFRTGCSMSLRVNYRLCGWLGSKSPNIWWKLNGPFPYWNVYFTASMFPRQCVTLYQVVGSALLLLTGHNKHERVSTVLGLLIVTFIVMAIGICLPHGSRHINIDKMRHGKGNPPGKSLPLCVTLCFMSHLFCILLLFYIDNTVCQLDQLSCWGEIIL